MRFLAVLLFATGCSAAAPSVIPSPAPSAQPRQQCHYQGNMPDPGCTPGVWNPAVTQATINRTICVSGWTDTIRPPSSYTTPLKRRQMIEYGLGGQPLTDFKLDHYFPLEGGGDPRDPRNLFPEPVAIARQKDVKEGQFHADICSARKTLAEAQRLWALNWQAYR